VSSLHDPAIAGSPSDLTPKQRETLDSALRVDHAGEIAANWIYKGQMMVLGSHPSAGALIQVGLSPNV
jgi:3-demethoxyubiquinol 3-hydroxylase